MKISGKMVGKIDVKRFYMPGMKISETCKCGKEVEFDLGSQYISYPVLGGKEPLNFYCQSCHTEWVRHVVINVSVESAE